MAHLGHQQASEIRHAVQSGAVVALFQPIERLDTGVCIGLEALARLDLDGALLTPDAFLPHLGDDERLSLFGAMLGQAIALLRSPGLADGGLHVSINVEISLVAGEDFCDVLRYLLDRYHFSGERVVLEILENEDIVDLARLQVCLAQVKALGLQLALDDVGTGYASLRRLRELPLDLFKLDRSVVQDLERHPDELSYVTSMLALARGTRKTMVAEGIESREVYDALRVLGVEAGQGYAIARPMPAGAVARWLAAREARAADRTPTSLLGAYACHLTVVETCRSLRAQPLPVAWLPEACTDHVGCPVGRLFGARGWHGTAFGEAHRRFHAALACYEVDPVGFDAAAESFRETMAAAIAADPAGTGCRVSESACGVPESVCGVLESTVAKAARVGTTGKPARQTRPRRAAVR